MNFQQWLAEQKKSLYNLRIGQAFCNQFISDAWPALYYEEDEQVAIEMIQTWLTQHHYHDTMPLTSPNYQDFIGD